MQSGRVRKALKAPALNVREKKRKALEPACTKGRERDIRERA
jgi:hypothetical protein